ncbi:conserved hypothetical protein (plasmid) [Borreliella burgdorferi ZS7]|uniref:Uncharacterized protein n=1 Tax=Borreliella burgdorferi (strain ZS7) TaxID=445985 RepID=A0A0H3BZJ1_BORBZ|nr:conserved hypothetical protein [Borreliella burgdorferi ZS7]
MMPQKLLIIKNCYSCQKLLKKNSKICCVVYRTRNKYPKTLITS